MADFGGGGPIDCPGLNIIRTGRAYAASHEFEITWPDATKGTLWSPPWNEYTEEKEDAEVRRVAGLMWRRGEHHRKGRLPIDEYGRKEEGEEEKQ